MDDWSRRRLLRALGIGAASTIAWACGGHRGPGVSAPTSALDDVAERLAVLGGRLAGLGRVQVVVHRHVVATADAGGAMIRDESMTRALAHVVDAHGRHLERSTSGAGVAELARVVDGVRGARPPAVLTRALPAQVDRAYSDADDPRRAIATAWLDQARALLARADNAGSSRVVYRAGYVEIDDSEIWSAGDHAVRHQRLVRARAGVLFVAWTDGRLVSAVAEVAAPIGLAIVDRLDRDTIAAAAVRALEPMTPGEGPRGDTAIVIDPSVVAGLCDRGLAQLLTTAAAQRGEAAAAGAWQLGAAVDIVDDARAAGYGGYAFDDDGHAAAEVALVRGGRRVGLLGGTAAAPAQQRRPGHVGRGCTAPAQLVIGSGTRPAAALVGDIDHGYLLEGAGPTQLDRGRWEIAIPIARARRIEHGRRTGHVYGDLELRGAVPALLGAVTGASAEVGEVAWRELADELPVWRSARAPWLATQGTLVARS